MVAQPRGKRSATSAEIRRRRWRPSRSRAQHGARVALSLGWSGAARATSTRARTAPVILALDGFTAGPGGAGSQGVVCGGDLEERGSCRGAVAAPRPPRQTRPTTPRARDDRNPAEAPTAVCRPTRDAAAIQPGKPAASASRHAAASAPAAAASAISRPLNPPSGGARRCASSAARQPSCATRNATCACYLHDQPPPTRHPHAEPPTQTPDTSRFACLV